MVRKTIKRPKGYTKSRIAFETREKNIHFHHAVQKAQDRANLRIVERPNQDMLEVAREIVIRRGESLCIQGAAGCGKSTLTKALVSELRELGHNVKTTALMHVATLALLG